MQATADKQRQSVPAQNTRAQATKKRRGGEEEMEMGTPWGSKM